MIKYFIINLFIGIHSIIFCLWGITLFILTWNDKKIHRFAARPWAKIILWASRVKINVIGLDTLDMTSPHIFMVNHQSYFDIFALLAGIPGDFKFILKQELMKVPLLGPGMKMAGYIGIDRRDPRKAITSVNKAVEKIRNGTSVLIFPEGTRNADGLVQPFKKGGFHLAFKSGIDIIPISIINSYQIAPKNEKKIYSDTIIMKIGTAISTKKFHKKEIDELIKNVREAIINQIDDYKRTIV
jgi:1-acyl-sn-glycerol-3-phosphate acyltransferase